VKGDGETRGSTLCCKKIQMEDELIYIERRDREAFSPSPPHPLDDLRPPESCPTRRVVKGDGETELPTLLFKKIINTELNINYLRRKE
jgi:hypothetical protein